MKWGVYIVYIHTEVPIVEESIKRTQRVQALAFTYFIYLIKIWKFGKMDQIITFVFFLGINTAMSKPIYGNLYEEQALHERIEQLSAIHEVLHTHGNRSLDIAKLHCLRKV